MSRLLTFPRLLSELRQLCADGASGFALIRPGAGKLIRLTFEHGEIVFMSCQDKSGMQVLPLLSEFESGQLDFVAGLGGTSKSPLPPTGEILSSLESGSTPVRETPVPKSAPGSAGPRDDDPGSWKILESTLADYIGPMAAVVCSAKGGGGRSLDTVIQDLAREIPDPENGRRFVEEVRAKLA